MTDDRKKTQKKKAREKAVQESRSMRDAKRAVKREELDDWRKKRELVKNEREMEKLYDEAAAIYAKLPAETRAQLEHNVKILQALEEEYDKEMNKKQTLNEELEAQGFKTPEEKMKALQERMAEEMQEQSTEVGIGGSADCSFTVNDPPAEDSGRTQVESDDPNTTKWLVTNSEPQSIFETHRAGFTPSPSEP